MLENIYNKQGVLEIFLWPFESPDFPHRNFLRYFLKKVTSKITDIHSREKFGEKKSLATSVGRE